MSTPPQRETAARQIENRIFRIAEELRGQEKTNFECIAQRINEVLLMHGYNNRVYTGENGLMATSGTLGSVGFPIIAASKAFNLPVAVTSLSTTSAHRRDAEICGYIVPPDMAEGIDRVSLVEGVSGTQQTSHYKCRPLFNEIQVLGQECVQSDTCVDIIKSKKEPPLAVFVSPNVFEEQMKSRFTSMPPLSVSKEDLSPQSGITGRSGRPISFLLSSFRSHRRKSLSRLEAKNTFGLIKPHSTKNKEILAIVLPEAWIEDFKIGNPRLNVSKVSGAKQRKWAGTDYRDLNADTLFLQQHGGRVVGGLLHSSHLKAVQEFKQQRTPLTVEKEQQTPPSEQIDTEPDLLKDYNEKAKQLNVFASSVFNAAAMAKDGTTSTTTLTSEKGNSVEITTDPDIIRDVKENGGTLMKAFSETDNKALTMAVAKSITRATNDNKSSVISIIFKNSEQVEKTTIQNVAVRPDPYKAAIEEFNF